MTDPNRDYSSESAPPRNTAHEESSVAPDAAALALRDMAQRLKRTEERSEKAFGAVGDNLRRILARLDEVERKLEAGAAIGPPGAGISAAPSGAEAALAAQIEALTTRLEDMSDALAAASGDIEAIRRRIDVQQPAPDGAPTLASAPPTAELMRALNARLEQTRAEAARAGGTAERAAREALAQAGESTRRADEVSAKLSLALANVAARVDAFEKRVMTAGAPVAVAAAPLASGVLAGASGPYEPGLEAADDYAHKDVAPYVARVERELESASAARGPNFFDRIAAAAEARVNVGRMPRAKDAEGYVAERIDAAAHPVEAVAPELAQAPPSRAERALPPKAERTPPPKAERAPSPAAPPVYAEAPEPPRVRPPEPAVEAEEDPYADSALAVVPGRKAKSGAAGRSANPRNEFDAAFSEDEEVEEGVGASVGDLRSRLRAKPLAAEEQPRAAKRGKAAPAPARKGKAAVEVEEDEEEEESSGRKRGGLFSFLRRDKSKAKDKAAAKKSEADEEEEEEEEDELPFASPAAKSAAKTGRRVASAKEKEALSAFADELEEDEEDWEDEVSRGRGLKRLILIGLLILAIVGFIAMRRMMSGGA